MEKNILLACYNCRLLYPGGAKCGVCGGSGLRSESMPVLEPTQAFLLLKDALDRLDGEGTILRLRDTLVHTLILWQIHGATYVQIKNNLRPGTAEFDRAVHGLGDRLVSRIRLLDQSL